MVDVFCIALFSFLFGLIVGGEITKHARSKELRDCMRAITRLTEKEANNE